MQIANVEDVWQIFYDMRNTLAGATTPPLLRNAPLHRRTAPLHRRTAHYCVMHRTAHYCVMPHRALLQCNRPGVLGPG